MINIFLKIAELIKEKKTTQSEVAKQLGVTQGTVSNFLKEGYKPSKSLEKLAYIIYGNERPPHPEPIIEKAILMMEDMEEDTKESAVDCIQKEKLLEELKRERAAHQEKKAA